MDLKIAPSMMCCDFLRLGEQLAVMEAQGVDLLHIDVMDGSFVPNFTLGTDFCRQLRRATKIPLDIHLMVEQPERHLDAFEIAKGEYVSVHWESTRHVQRVLCAIKQRGGRALLALNPATPVEMVTDVLEDIDGLLLMSVNPGFAGQKMIPHAIEKIRRARAFLDANGRTDAEIEVDGNVSFENAEKMKAAGANILVAGSSSVFANSHIAENIQKLR